MIRHQWRIGVPSNRSFGGDIHLDILEPHVTLTPQQENFKNFKFFQTSLKILNIYFWGDKVDFRGNKVWGNQVYSRGILEDFRICVGFSIKK